MSVGKLIAFFSTFTKLPVYAEDVRDQLIDMGIQDNIHIESMDVSPGDLLGFFVRFRDRRIVYSEPIDCVAVFYNENVDADKQNLICIKELMHVFDDKINAATSNSADLKVLIDDIFSVHLPEAAFDLSIAGTVDLIAMLIAVAVMFPHEAREDFVRAFNDGKMTAEQIAVETGLPINLMPQLLSRQWEVFRDIVVKL